MNRFDVKALETPDAFHWPGYFWLWNDVLQREKLFRQLRDMDAVGAKNVWILPVPADFRPNSMKTNLQPEYLSEEYLAILDDLVAEMKRLGMKLWLYDEGGWPSGGNCGRIVREHPDWARQTLVKRDVGPGEIERVPDDCIAAFQAGGNGGGRRLGPGETLAAGRGAELYCAELGHETALVPSYPDLLNPEVTKTFIAGSHEAYKRALGRHFGETIPLVISDEPRVDNPPWTGDLASASRPRRATTSGMSCRPSSGRTTRPPKSASTTSTGGRSGFPRRSSGRSSSGLPGTDCGPSATSAARTSPSARASTGSAT